MTLSVADGTGTIGQQVNVQLDALGIGTPGLGAYTVDVAFDTNIVTAVSCNGNSGPGVTPVAPVNTPAFEAPGLSFCNPKYAENTVRSVGAVAEGASGDVPLAVITFTCDAAGTTGLTISVSTFADATVGSPTDINHTEDNGTITCS